MSDGMLTRLNRVVIFVMTCNLNAMIDKVIAWQLDILLICSAKEQKTRISQTAGRISRIANTVILFRL